MAIVTYPLNGVEYTAEDAEGYLCTRASGVFSAENQFVARASGGMGVTVSPGVAWIKNNDFSGKSIVSRDKVNLTVPTANGALPRRDRIVLRFDKAKNETALVIKEGTPAATAAAPAVTQTEMVYELGLYTILVPAAALSIDDSNIENTMLDESVCGVMRDAVTGLPTEQMGLQWNALVSALAGALQDVQAGVLLRRTVYHAVIPAYSWSVREDGAYVNEVGIAGILAEDEGDCDVDMSGASASAAADRRDAWALVDDVETINGGIRAVCFGDMPFSDIPIVLEVIR